jgi:hypothetical protein
MMAKIYLLTATPEALTNALELLRLSVLVLDRRKPFRGEGSHRASETSRHQRRDERLGEQVLLNPKLR